MQKREQYKRMLRFLLSVFFLAAETGMFYYVWMSRYSGLMEKPFQRKGNWLMGVILKLG